MLNAAAWLKEPVDAARPVGQYLIAKLFGKQLRYRRDRSYSLRDVPQGQAGEVLVDLEELRVTHRWEDSAWVPCNPI